jgi:hypothetical protein
MVQGKNKIHNDLNLATNNTASTASISAPGNDVSDNSRRNKDMISLKMTKKGVVRCAFELYQCREHSPTPIAQDSRHNPRIPVRSYTP